MFWKATNRPQNLLLNRHELCLHGRQPLLNGHLRPGHDHIGSGRVQERSEHISFRTSIQRTCHQIVHTMLRAECFGGLSKTSLKVPLLNERFQLLNLDPRR